MQNNDLISREALLDIVGKMPLDWEYGKAVSDIYDIIKAAPAVDAVVFPCKPMDTVYFIECRTDGNHKIRNGFALSVEYSACYKPLVTIRYNDNTVESTKHYLGLKAFMTREEAEAALAKMKEGAENA